MSADQLLTRGLLLGGFMVFVLGAIAYVSGGWVTLSYEEGLRQVAAKFGLWSFSSICLAVSLILTVAGLALFNEYFSLDGAKMLAIVGFVVFFIGALAWLLAMGYRLSVDTWAAQIMAETTSLPPSLAPLRRLESVMHDMFMYSTLAGSAIYGLALLKSGRFPSAVGWFAVTYGSFMVIWEALSAGPIPAMALIVPLVLGLAPLPELPAAGQAGKLGG